MADAPTFQIPRDVIEPIIAAHVATAVTAALGDKAKIVSDAVWHVMNAKVRAENGEKPSYSSNSDIAWIQWAMGDCIRKTVKATLETELEKHADVIRKHIADQLKNSRSPLVKQLVEGMVAGVTGPLQYRLSVRFDPTER